MGDKTELIELISRSKVHDPLVAVKLQDQAHKITGLEEEIKTLKAKIDETKDYPVAYGLAADLDMAMHEIARLKASAWISVEDRLPNDGDPILIYEPHCKNDMVNGIESAASRADLFAKSSTGEYWVTHWQPLPAKPEEY